MLEKMNKWVSDSQIIMKVFVWNHMLILSASAEGFFYVACEIY